MATPGPYPKGTMSVFTKISDPLTLLTAAWPDAHYPPTLMIHEIVCYEPLYHVHIIARWKNWIYGHTRAVSQRHHVRFYQNVRPLDTIDHCLTRCSLPTYTCDTGNCLLWTPLLCQYSRKMEKSNLWPHQGRIQKAPCPFLPKLTWPLLVTALVRLGILIFFMETTWKRYSG